MWQFMEATRAQHGALPPDYAALHAWSVAEPEAFYSSLWDFLDIIGTRGDVIVQPAANLRDVRFFPEARVNYAENLLRCADETPALIAYREDGECRRLTRAELYAAVSRLVQALRADGVGVGDRVAAIVTNEVEACIAYLAVASVGAIWSSCSPDFGPASAVDRLGQISPTVLIAVTRYHYGGKTFDTTATIRAVAAAVTHSLQRVVLVTTDVPASLNDLLCQTWNDYLAPFAAQTIEFARLPFSARLAILFSSGTTGKPKGIMHSGGGLLLQHKKELQLHCDLRQGERLFYFTTCGWMMWNWQLSALAVGATLVLFDGSPGYPDMKQLPALIERENVNVFGTSARYLDGCAKAVFRPNELYALRSLRLMLSTGSPLLESGFEHVYRDWKLDVDLASISGGTDICGCFLGGNPLIPVRSGELKCAMLGMDIDVVDARGDSVSEIPGELICRNAHISMPVGFWDDEAGVRYRQAYFSSFPGVWTHGDLAERCASGGFIIHGRSDNTLNPGGVRIGSAEIYRQLEGLHAIAEAVAVGRDVPGDQQVVLFVKMQSGVVLDPMLISDIRSRIRSGATPRHVPAYIIAAPDVPRTQSGKTSEAAVREAINGRPVRNEHALINPGVLEFYRSCFAE